MKYKKGFTFIEILISVAILAMAVLSLFLFDTKIKNKSVTEDARVMAFYNNVSGFEIIQSTLNETGNIDTAVKKAIQENAGYIGRYVKTLMVEVHPIIIYHNNVDISEINPNATPVDENRDGIIDYHQENNVHYYQTDNISNIFTVDYCMPIYEITINTRVGVNTWEDLEVKTLVAPNSFIFNYS